MKELSKRGESFYVRWEERRKKKWRFVIIQSLRHTLLGMSFVVVIQLWNGNKIENLHLFNLLFLPLIFLILGLFEGLFDFKRNEKIYSDFLNHKEADEEAIMKGILLLKAGNTWSFESLKIQGEANDSLLIQNELFWFDEKVPSSEKMEECYQSVYDDFQQLQKNKNFEEYSKNRKVKIRIIDNSQSNVPLLEKAI